jgi:hypothetical protein
MLTTSCNHDDKIEVAGPGGAASISVYPQHHEVARNLVNFKVYIKYNTSDAPAGGKYDDSLTCSNHDSLVSCKFTNLKNGKYYMYAYGYDTSIAQNVKGGAPYTITKQVAQDFFLPVSE